MKTLPESWKIQLHQHLSRKNNRLGLPRTCLVGIGSDLRGDDSAGLLVARGLLHLQSNNLLIIDGGPAPENFSSKIKKFNPDLVIFIDAAHMDEPPGTIKWIPLESIDGMSASTHSLPLSILANFLFAELGCDVTVLGIQPAQNEIGSNPSVSVQAAVEGILTELKKVFSPA